MKGDRLPLFCSSALAGRIERVEVQLVASGSEAARRRRADGAGVVITIAGGVASFAEERSPFSKVAGLGFGGVPSAAALDEIERAFRSSAYSPGAGPLPRGKRRRIAQSVGLAGAVDEAQRPTGGPLDGDHEADAVGAAAGKGSARVLDADRVHEAAALVGTLLDHAALKHRHAVGVGEVGDGERYARIAAHVFRLPCEVGGADEYVVVLQSDPHYVVAGGAVCPQGGEVHVVGRVEKRANVGGERTCCARVG